MNDSNAFHYIQKQISNGIENENVLWDYDMSVQPHLGYLSYFVIMNLMKKANTCLTLLSHMNDDCELVCLNEIFNKYNIGSIMKFSDIYYTKDYQQSFLHLTHSIRITEAIECLNKTSRTDMEPMSNLISILLKLNNIIYFDITYILIGRHELSVYECIKTILSEKYDRTLTILLIPMLRESEILLDSFQDQILLSFEPHRKALVLDYFRTLMNNLFPQEIISNEIDMITIIKNKILLAPVRSIFIAVSFLTDKFYILKKHWKKNVNKKDSSMGTGKSIDGIEGHRKGFEPSIGGKFIIIDWSKKEIVYTLDFDAASGFFIKSNHLYVANNRLNYIAIIDLNTRQEIQRIDNQAFNCIHNIHSIENESILVTSTGIDAILQVDLHGEILQDWYATEHGYTTTPKGEERHVLRNFDHHHYTYPTLHQTTHINSSILLNDDYFLATLFHQGQLVKINRQHGQLEVLLSELRCPHGIKRFKSSTEENNIEWMLCNTKQNEILFLNETFGIRKKMLLEDINWLQDATQIHRTDNILIADANNSRIIEIDPLLNTVVSEFNYSTDWRIYQISDLDDFQTDFIPCLK